MIEDISLSEWIQKHPDEVCDEVSTPTTEQGNITEEELFEQWLFSTNRTKLDDEYVFLRQG
ncbi:hypothetical protein C6H65_23925 [Photorhabdus luminescens]|nr:hypothetical protein KS18_19105 [Photorhabdus luminescens]PQQ35564.1 hypothetical protein C6H65_23925 [Photorhabdus luminescens]